MQVSLSQALYGVGILEIHLLTDILQLANMASVTIF
jgi:hypothetical protein